MPRSKIDFDAYKVKAFLDTNIILEGRPLADLPWHEIDAHGPIIALMTPTAIKELDAKKQDGRVGKWARAFNRLIGPVAAGAPPLVILESGPRVELALSGAVRIPWDQHDELDPDDGDSCIVAEALHARDMNDNGKMIISHDLKPISFAAHYNIESLHVSDNWLRPTEPSRADKEVQRLKSQLSEYLATEPQFEITIEMLDGEPLPVVGIEDLTDAERMDIERKIIAGHPEQDQQLHPSLMYGLGSYDHSYSDRYKAYRRRIPIFMSNYAQRLERLFNQVRLRIVLVNTGKMQAENLLVDVSVSSGWLHDRYVHVSPLGPIAPRLRTDPLRHFPSLGLDHRLLPPRVGRHEFAFKDEPNWRSSFSVTCEDFRHGADWAFEGIVGIDPREAQTTIAVEVTASNFRGKAQRQKTIERNSELVHVSKLVDLNSLKITVPTPISFLRSSEYEQMIDLRAFALGDDAD